MGAIPDGTELYSEARVFVGFEDLTGAPLSAALGGLGVRAGSGPVQVNLAGHYGGRSDLDIRLEWAGYAHLGHFGVRTAAGPVATWDAAHGKPDWTEGLAADLDLGVHRHVEIFGGAALTEHFVPDWRPGHGVVQLDGGFRYVGWYYGIEVRVIGRFAYTDGWSRIVSVGLVGRWSFDQHTGEVSKTTPLTEIGGRRAPLRRH
jgi:hypothetical protein